MDNIQSENTNEKYYFVIVTKDGVEDDLNKECGHIDFNVFGFDGGFIRCKTDENGETIAMFNKDFIAKIYRIPIEKPVSLCDGESFASGAVKAFQKNVLMNNFMKGSNR